MAYELTKMDLAAMKLCDWLVVRDDANDRSIYAIKRANKTEANPFADEQRHRINASVRIAVDWKQDATDAQAFALLYVYRSQITEVSSILATLRVGDEIEFQFAADYHQTESLREAGWAHDALLLKVRRGGKEHSEFELAHSVCEVFSRSRMVRGVTVRAPVAAITDQSE